MPRSTRRWRSNQVSRRLSCCGDTSIAGRHQQALDALRTAEKLGTQDPWLQNNWADLLIDEGNYEAAASKYRKVIDSRTPNKKAKSAAFDGLINYYSGTGKLDETDQTYRKLLAFEPGSAWNYGNYARFLLCWKDDYDGAITRSRQALDIMDYGVGRYWLAAGLYRKWAQYVLHGDPGAGKAYFLEASAIYPDPNEVVAGAQGCPAVQLIGTALERGKGMAGQ